MTEEVELSALRGSQHTWWVAERYDIFADEKIQANVIVPIGRDTSRWKTYHPFAFQELPAEFAKLKSGDRQKTFEFVHKWGLLGHNYLLLTDFPDPNEANKHQGRSGGDPINWIQNHADTVDKLLYLLEQRRESRYQENPGILWDAIWNLAKRDLIPGGLVAVRYASGTLAEPQAHLITGDLQSVESVVARLLTAIIRPNLKLLTASVFPDGGNVKKSFDFRALLTVIYSLLADAAVGDFAYVQCLHCHNYFRQTHAKQKFCPHPINPIEGESICGQAYRRPRRKR